MHWSPRKGRRTPDRALLRPVVGRDIVSQPVVGVFLILAALAVEVVLGLLR